MPREARTLSVRVSTNQHAVIQKAAKDRGITLSSELLSGRWAHLGDPKKNPQRLGQTLGPPPPGAELLLALTAIKTALAVVLEPERRHRELIRETQRVRRDLARVNRLLEERAGKSDQDAAHLVTRCRQILTSASYVLARLEEADPRHPRQATDAIRTAILSALPSLNASIESVARLIRDGQQSK